MLAVITLLVTLLGLMLAALAIGIGVATFWGMAGVKEEAGRVADRVANAKLSDYFEKQAEKDRLRTIVVPAPDPRSGEEDANDRDNDGEAD